MSHNSTTTDTDDIEFTATYGTAVVMTVGVRPSDMRRRQPEPVGETSGELASWGNAATANDQHWVGHTSSTRAKRFTRSTDAHASRFVPRPRSKQGTTEATGRGPANDDSLRASSDTKRRRKSVGLT
jgi:hypothetical protein